MSYALADASNVVVSQYDFGEGDLRNVLGEPVPCPLDGIIAAPEGDGPFPLVVVFHGLRRVQNVYDTVYDGFDYLIQQLAAEGYVAIAYNVNIEYESFKFGESSNYEWAYELYHQQMALLRQANDGQESGHGIALEGKIDFGQIHFLGHSRGGEMADLIYRYEQQAGVDAIRSIVRVTTATLVFDEPYPDVPTGMIISEFDGDTPEAGQLVYDEIRAEAGRTAPASLVYLRGANHAFFNRTFTRDEATSFTNRLTREQQENFLMHYAAAFYSVYADGQPPFGMWDPQQPQPSTMFGFTVTASAFSPPSQSLLEASEAGAAQATASGGATVSYLLKTFDDDMLFNHPGGTMELGSLPLFSLRWTGPAGQISWPIDGVGPYDALTLYIAVDSSDPANPSGEGQSLTVSLTDTQGKVSHVVIPRGTSALAWHDGEVLEVPSDTGPSMVVWRGFMPLGALRIPLTFFDGVDLTSVNELSIAFDQTDSGAVMLAGVYLEGGSA